MAISSYSTDPEGAAALIAQAESEGVRLSVTPGGGLRCVGRMSQNLRAGLVSSKKLVLVVLAESGSSVDTLGEQGALVPSDQSPLLDQLDDATEDLAGASIIESRQEQEPGAVLIQSPRFGPLWIALTSGMADELRGEEAQRSEPRPVLELADVAALRGKSEAATKATLEVFRVFGEARVQ